MADLKSVQYDMFVSKLEELSITLTDIIGYLVYQLPIPYSVLPDFKNNVL